jgi:hypothetical protein
MTLTRLEWPPGPPPPADGLHTAFRAADRRRARSAAVLAVVPALLATALVMTTALHNSGTDSLQLPPAERGPATTTERQAPDAAVAGGDAAQVAGQPAPAPAAAPPAAGSAPAGESRSAGVATAPAPKPAPAGSIDVVAQRSARVQIRLTKATHPDFFRTAFDRSGRYAGVWVVNADGDVVGATLELVDRKGQPADRFTQSLPVLPAGTYTFYVAGAGPTGVHIPLESGEKGLSARATRAVTSTYTTTSHTLSPAETSGSLRMHLPTTPGVGYAGGFIDNAGGVASTVTACLPRRDAECQSGDPESDGTQLTVGGSVGSVFDLTPDLLRQRRDVLLDADVHGTTPTELVCWSVAIALV